MENNDAQQNMANPQNLAERDRLREEKLRTESEDQVIKDFKRYVLTRTHKKFKDPRRMIDKRVKHKIRLGENLFNREFNTRQGYTKLLNKIADSNFTLRQIKNGCSTLFDKQFMRINYTNPLLSQDEVKAHMQEYFDKTRP